MLHFISYEIVQRSSCDEACVVSDSSEKAQAAFDFRRGKENGAVITPKFESRDQQFGFAGNITKIRTLLGAAQPEPSPRAEAEIIPLTLREPCPCCGGPMRIVEIFRRGQNCGHMHHLGSRQHDDAPIKLLDQLRFPVRAPGWRRLRKAAEPAESQIAPTLSVASFTENRRCEFPACARITLTMPARRDSCPHPQRSFPIDRPKPPRLPPWEVFQRGPIARQAQPSRNGPHRKTFTIAVIGQLAGLS